MSLSPATAPTCRRDLVVVSIVCGMLLLPFLAKPLHVDDPLFVWCARQITAHPLAPYGFTGNWDGHRQPFYQFMQNPPLVPYYVAAAATVLGWTEVGLHVAFLPVAILAAVGTYLLAAQFCRRPLAAALMLVASPAFLVSCTTLMSEGPLLCLWVWATYLWVRGSAATSPAARWGLLTGAGLAVTAATLAKYPGINLIPLLVAHAVLCPPPTRRARVAQAVALLVPIALLFGYDRATAARYGYGLLSDAIGFSRSANGRNPIPLAGRALDGLCFLGGGCLPAAAVGLVAFAGPGGRSPWGRRFAIPVTVAALALAAGHHFSPPVGWARADGPSIWGFFGQCGLMATAGVAVVGLCAVGVGWTAPPADRRRGLFLLVWVAGVFTFATFLNWAVNIRSILPLLPAACILAVRAVDRPPRDDATRIPWPVPFGIATAVAGGVAVLVAVADLQFAVHNRTAAVLLSHDLGDAAAAATPPGGHRPRVWFGGHWGFQFYMERGGASPLDDDHRDYAAGDFVVLPLDNYGTRPLAAPLEYQRPFQVGTGSWLSTMKLSMGAGFYFSPGDRLPFVVGPIPPDAYLIARVAPSPARR